MAFRGVEDEDLPKLFEQYGGQRAVCREMGWSQSSFSVYLSKKPGLRAECAQAATKAPPRQVSEVVKWNRNKNKKYEPPPPHIFGTGPGVEADIERIREIAEKRYEAKAQRAQQKQCQSIRFEHGPVAIFFLSDQHIGGDATNVPRMFAEQEQINATPGAYVFQGGDVVDQYIVGKLQTENFKNSLPIWEQWQLAQHYLKTFGSKLIAFHAGNHDMWHSKLAGFDYTREIAPNGILYDSDEIKVTIQVGDNEVKVWSRHKWLGSSIHNQTHGQERAAKFDDSGMDVYVGAHRHTGAVAREFTLGDARKIAIQTGTYKVLDGWAREMGFHSNDSSTAAALVINESGSFWATSSIQCVMDFMNVCYAA